MDVRLWMDDALHSARIIDALQQVDTALGDSASMRITTFWS